jgi:hypothetical protein
MSFSTPRLAAGWSREQRLRNWFRTAASDLASVLSQKFAGRNGHAADDLVR